MKEIRKWNKYETNERKLEAFKKQKKCNNQLLFLTEDVSRRF